MIIKRILLVLSLLISAQSSIFANDTCDSSFLNTGAPLTPEEVQQITHMKNSMFCRGNCAPTAEKLARYLITKDPKYIALPPILERLQIGSRAFSNFGYSLLGIAADTPMLETINSFADIIDIDYFEGRVDSSYAVRINDLIESLQQSGPGSHAIVHAEYNSALTPWGHAFNILHDTEGIKVIGYKNSTVLSYHTWSPEFEELFLERYQNDFAYIRFKAPPTP